MTATKHVMVIGGGITGLSAAFHLSRILPAVRITLLESRPRLGGWIKSDRLELEDERGERGSVVLESGPRTLRPNSGALLELVHLLGLKDQLVTVSKSAPAARNRYIFFSPLTLLPSSLLGALATPFNPLLRPLLPAILGEPLRRANRPPKAEDESVNSFFTRRFGVDFARRFGSALVHGIYAADSRELSVRSAFPALWAAEELGRGSVVLGMRAAGRVLAEDMSGYDMGDVGQMMRNVSVYSFKEGMETLPRAMEAELATRANVRIIKGTGVVSVYAEEEDFKVRASRELPEDCPTHIISALPFQSLPEILPDPGLHFLIPHSHYSSVLLLNLVFPRFPHPAGFGYLVPRPEGGYSEVTEDNPGILGTVFDSVALGEQDTLPGAVKMTMMSGGPYKRRFGEPYLPEFLAALRQHLGIPVPDPLYHRFVVAKKCIPTPGMEHSARVAQLRHALLERPYAGRLEMIGAEAGGVSVGDCVRQGKEAALRIAQSVRG
ncbi:Protoporphyrinogen oxidase [Dacryopinax primogenitus]|uniref:Protoporphyrinogen oxidase n=1 Tax=Dacryopinax primogenitus (strain DJM 731) TaxID=1858805 RepID=M5G0Q8_DACPD|nr:Protoporphyrinogen oxidase [Dacryopinax primogenitus]EJU02334.1 Protoporphyrinogen oxidase [Dacryopinax primogenitus]